MARTNSGEGTVQYLTLGELADTLGRSTNTLKQWAALGYLPDPDAHFGSLGSDGVRVWGRDRVLALLVDDETQGYEWETTPKQYLTSQGVAELLHLSPNTIKWWLRDEDARRSRWPYTKVKELIALPMFDGESAWVYGWTIPTIWNWWNNDHPVQVGEHNRHPSAIATDLLDGHTVALVDHSRGLALQVRPDPELDDDTVEYLSAADVLAAARTDEPFASDSRPTPGCWFVPDLSSLDEDDQKKVLTKLAGLNRPTVVLHTEPVEVPRKLPKSAIRAISADELEDILNITDTAEPGE